MTLVTDPTICLAAERIKCVRQLGWLALLALLAGCSSTSSNYRESVDTLKFALHSRERIDPTPASVAAKPYFQLESTSPNSRAVLILGSVEGNLQGWYGQGGQAIFLANGVVVRTIGLQQNLDDTHWPASNPFATGLQRLVSPVDAVRIVDWSPGYRYGVTAHLHLVPAGMEDVNILGTVHHLLRVDEHVTAPTVGLVAENRYWVDPSDGFIWKSHQVVARGLPLDLVQLRPYRVAKP
jgi:hypothetical protein